MLPSVIFDCLGEIFFISDYIDLEDPDDGVLLNWTGEPHSDEVWGLLLQRNISLTGALLYQVEYQSGQSLTMYSLMHWVQMS